MGGRGLGPPREMIEDLFDHRRIFDARDDLDRATAVLAGQDVDFDQIAWSDLTNRLPDKPATRFQTSWSAAHAIFLSWEIVIES